MLICDTQERCQITKCVACSSFTETAQKTLVKNRRESLVQFVCLHEDRKSSLSTAVWPSMNPSDPYWNEAVQAKVTSELVSVLFLFVLT